MSKWAKIKTSLVKFLKEMRRINYPQAQPPVETIKLGCGDIAMEWKIRQRTSVETTSLQ